jgi:hypothetical protein
LWSRSPLGRNRSGVLDIVGDEEDRDPHRRHHGRVPSSIALRGNPLELLEEPWYVNLGILAGVVVLTGLTRWLKNRGWWPDTGDNYSFDKLVWIAIVLGVGGVVLAVLFFYRLVTGTL